MARQQVLTGFCWFCLVLFLLPLGSQGSDRSRSNGGHYQASSDNHNQAPDSDQDPAASHDQASPDDSSDTSTIYLPPVELEIVRLNDTSVVLKWDISYASREHLQFFKIQYKSTRKDADWKTDNREIPPTTRAYQINGLRPGNYFFIVSAVYDNDDNVSSEQYKFRLRARSKIPSEEMPEQRAPVIYWSHAEFDYFRFKWKYSPKEHDMPWFGYLVYYRSAHAVTEFTIYNTLDESVEIAEVEPETPYEAKVVAYNKNGVSDFSETISIKTKARPNVTAAQGTTVPPSLIQTTITTSARKPIPSNSQPSISETPPANSSLPTSHTTPFVSPTLGSPRPMVVPISNNVTNSNHNFNDTSTHHPLSEFIELILGNQSNTSTLAFKYATIVFISSLFFVLASFCLISCHRRRKDSPDSSTNASMQFDLEINGYFKNSFPGVEKEYSPIHNHDAHHGFVNNHPHINDFT